MMAVAGLDGDSRMVPLLCASWHQMLPRHLAYGVRIVALFPGVHGLLQGPVPEHTATGTAGVV